MFTVTERVEYRDWREWRFVRRYGDGQIDCETSPELGWQRIGRGKIPKGYRGQGKYWDYAWSFFVDDSYWEKKYLERIRQREEWIASVYAKQNAKEKP